MRSIVFILLHAVSLSVEKTISGHEYYVISSGDLAKSDVKQWIGNNSEEGPSVISENKRSAWKVWKKFEIQLNGNKSNEAAAQKIVNVRRASQGNVASYVNEDDYNSLRLQYLQQNLGRNDTLNLSDGEFLDKSERLNQVIDTWNGSTGVETTVNCTDESGYGINAARCLLKNFKNEIDMPKGTKRKLGAHILITLVVIISIIMICLWITRGWCCCCCPCNFCKPDNILEKTRRYIAVNSPGVWEDGESGYTLSYEPSADEIILYERLCENMMSTEENRQTLEGELNFTQAVNDLKKKIQSLPSEGSSKKIGLERTKSNSLQLIQQVTNQGINSSALTNHIERFLSTTTLPKIQDASKISLGTMLQCVDNAEAIVTIDLGLTAAISFHNFRELFNIAGKHCSELTTRAQSPLNVSSNSKPIGYIVFAQNFLALMQEANKETALSPTAYFRDITYSFSLKSLKDGMSVWRQMRHLFDELKKSVADSENLISTGSGAANGIGSVAARSQRSVKTVQKILDNVNKLSDNFGDFYDLGRAKFDATAADTSKHGNYMDFLNRYLTDLATLAMDNAPKDPVPITFHNLLKRSAVQILDTLVFKHHIEPAALEKKAQQLGFNLCASLIWGCCPPLPQVILQSTIEVPLGTIVLNDYEGVVEEKYRVMGVAEILQELLSIIKTEAGSSVTRKNLFDLRDNCEVVAILKATSQLRFELLENCKEKALNLYNLMCLHCWLSSKISEEDPLFQSVSIRRFCSTHFYCYRMTDKSFVSLAELEFIIFGEYGPNSLIMFNDGIFGDIESYFLAPLCIISGCPPVLNVIKWSTDLKNVIQEYLVNHVKIEGQLISIPPFLEWYLNHLLHTSEKENTKSILKCLVDFLLQNDVKQLGEIELQSFTPSEIGVEKKNTEVILRLDYEPIESESIHSLESSKDDEKKIRMSQWRSRGLSEAISHQLSQSSRILTDLVQRIHEGQIEIGRDVLLDDKLRYIDGLLSATWATTLAILYQDNVSLAALTKIPESEVLWQFLEKFVKAKEWNLIFDIINALPDYFVMNDRDLMRLRDLVVWRMTTEFSKKDNIIAATNCCQIIFDFRLRLECILKNCPRWPGNVCIKQLSSLMLDENSDSENWNNLIKLEIKKINLFNTIAESLEEYEGKSWFDLYQIALEDPKNILLQLSDHNLVSLIFDWMQLPNISKTISSFVTPELLIKLSSAMPQHIQSLLSPLTSEQISELCDEALTMVNSVCAAQAIANLYIQVSNDEKKIKKWSVISLSLKLLMVIEPEEQLQVLHLVTDPILIIEQLLMNTKLDALTVLLKKLNQLPERELINEKSLNELLLKYASKAVEVNVITVVKQSSSVSFLLNSPPAVPTHVVLPEVPSKEDWIPDNQVTICMNCHLVNFSMFNRRHHCRRCGRVVCSSCSKHRIKVDGYKNVAVRVCQSCYMHYVKLETDAMTIQTDISSISDADHQWKLTADLTRNTSVRDEFSYDYAPDVSLCLAIFNLLPPLPIYTKVLLDLSEKLLQLFLTRDNTQNHEVDFTMLLQIVRSLIIGAKVRYGQVAMTAGMDSCDQLLGLVDLLYLIVKHHCLHLIPSEPLKESFVRQLRDRLVREELWDLAIEVSTKGGLSPNGVWAAWGKVSLAAGDWLEARAKFEQCLSAGGSRSSPLLDEICDILNSTTISSFNPTGSAPEVDEILATAQAIASGKSLPKSSQNQCGPKSPQHAEQIFYLNRYGGKEALLQFYGKRQEWNLALEHILSHNSDPDLVLTTLILPSYKNNTFAGLKKEMCIVDPSLNLFQKYLLHACLYLERKRYLHSLLDLQLFMQDYIRAAMTCIQLYEKEPIKGGFVELNSRAEFLHTALKHLENELTVSHKKINRLDHIMRLDNRDINRHMSTIWRQMEVAKYLAGCQTSGQPVMSVLNDLDGSENPANVPTLFNGQPKRFSLAVLCILSGRNVEEGFGVSFRIMQDYQLDVGQICLKAAEKLAHSGRGAEIEHLISCIQSASILNSVSVCDSILSVAVPAVIANSNDLLLGEKLSLLITNLDLRIAALIDARQLKAAYLLAVNHNKLIYVKRILGEADRLGQTAIKNICCKKLGLDYESSESIVGSWRSSAASEYSDN